MDAFKSTEIKRMQLGGNKAWQNFFNANSGLSWDDCTIKERYDTEAGEEYKERLSAKCEEKEFDAVAFAKQRAEVRERIAAKERERSVQNSRSGTPMGGNRRGTGNISNTNSRGQSPAPGGTNMPLAQKAQNEAYFARLGGANASRPDDVPPSQGGKYAGFGSSVPEPVGQNMQGGGGVIDDFQKDPIGAITKGFGWFSATVTKQAKVVNESYIQPTAKNVSPGPHTSICFCTILTHPSSHKQTSPPQPPKASQPSHPASHPARKAQPSNSINSSRDKTMPLRRRPRDPEAKPSPNEKISGIVSVCRRVNRVVRPRRVVWGPVLSKRRIVRRLRRLHLRRVRRGRRRMMGGVMIGDWVEENISSTLCPLKSWSSHSSQVGLHGKYLALHRPAKQEVHSR